jgi:hypothetical protein
MSKQPRRPNRRGAQQNRAPKRKGAVAARRGQLSREDLFASLRSGAANVAGVSYQIAVTALLLATSRAGADSGPPVITVRPEGWEDVDCDLEGGVTLLVQTKERGPEARAIGLAELARIIAHAAPSLLKHVTTDPDKQTPGAPQTARFAVVTNGEFGSGLPVTGWSATLTEVMPESSTMSELVNSVGPLLKDQGLAESLAVDIVSRTQLVVTPINFAAATIEAL